MNATAPKSGRTPAQRKRDQRLRAAIDATQGNLDLNAEAMTEAILDAMAIMIREGDAHAHAEVILRYAASGFRAPRPTRWEMKRRLARRIPKLLREG